MNRRTLSPLVTVLMPVYNGEKYLKQAIESILNQTFSDFEFIIVDDGSTDGSAKIVTSYNDPRIRYVRNKKNMGIVYSLNLGTDLARGKYIARMDADDISLPERLERQIHVLKEDNTKVLFSTIRLIDEHNRFIGIWQDDKNCRKLNELIEMLPVRNCLAHPTLMTEASLLKRYRYNRYAKHAEDYNLWLRMISDGIKYVKIDEELLYYRVHQDSITKSQSRDQISSYKKNILAKFWHLLYKIKKISINAFDWRVAKYLIVDIGNMSKEILKEPLKNILMMMGRYGWYLYPMHIDTDILFVFNTCDMGGAEKVHSEILKVAQKHKSITLLTSKSRDRHFCNEYRRLTQLIDLSWLSNYILGRWLVAGYMQIMIENSNLKILFGSRSGLFYDVLNTRIYDKLKVIELFHAMDGNLEYYSIYKSDLIDTHIFIDEGTKENYSYLMEKLGIDPKMKNKNILIENGVSIRNLVDSHQDKKSLKVLYVGRDAPVKRLHLIRDVAKKLKDISFKFVGVSPNHMDSKNIDAIGKVYDLDPYYSDADILLMTSSREGFPMAIMEAMAHGVVVISTDVGGISKHVKNAYNGFLIKGDDEKMIIEDAVSIIGSLDRDRDKLKSMSIYAYEYAKKHFDIKHFYKKYESLFEDALYGASLE
ncbi:glycosyltransferase [Nitratifractor salsuginis]|uniref:Glycosyl transferase family 2 n=1 Tax=Nitratifractor salsuginis (strain DSM 16511 / JCM 12458 / E9I37-1) TaxID=749222 RepID=E6X2V6_NITSE|nr:glycosyltransferase [Nitratifractor salsuginis]ADV47239.1 glycosyl transferase family 2 [Nitratifractor salsuginis DSM 16511]